MSRICHESNSTITEIYKESDAEPKGIQQDRRNTYIYTYVYKELKGNMPGIYQEHTRKRPGMSKTWQHNPTKIIHER